MGKSLITTVDSSPTTFQIGGLKVTFRPEGVYLRHTDKVNGSYGTDYFRDGNPFSEEEVGVILQIIAEFVAETAEECGREASRACATVIGVENGTGMEESGEQVSGDYCRAYNGKNCVSVAHGGCACYELERSRKAGSRGDDGAGTP